MTDEANEKTRVKKKNLEFCQTPLSVKEKDLTLNQGDLGLNSVSLISHCVESGNSMNQLMACSLVRWSEKSSLHILDGTETFDGDSS